MPIVNWLKNDLDPIQEELFFAFGLQSTQFVCNAFNQPAILYRLAIPMQFELNVPGSAGDLAIVSGICGMVIDCVENSGIASKSARVRTLDCKPIEIEVQLSGLSEVWWECSGIA